MESRLRQTLRNLQLIATYMISDCESPIIFHFSFDIFHLPFKRLWFAILILVRPDESPRRGLFQWANEKCQMTNGKWFGLLTAHCLLLTVFAFGSPNSFKAASACPRKELCGCSVTICEKYPRAFSRNSAELSVTFFSPS